MNTPSKPGGEPERSGDSRRQRLLPIPNLRGRRRRGASLFILLTLTSIACSADPPPKAPVPPSPYIGVVYRFADNLLEHGRDTYGPHKSGLFLSALDRKTLTPLTTRPPAPAGVSEEDRAGPKDGPLTGANLQHDQNLLRLLYTLSELSSKPVYREAADSSLKWLLQNAPSVGSGIRPWSRRIAWDAVKDEATSNSADARMDYIRPWMLWDRCFDLASESAKQMVGEPLDLSATFDFPARVGYTIRSSSVALARTKIHPEHTDIETTLKVLETMRGSESGLLPIGSSRDTTASPPGLLSLAIDCDGAAHRVPEPLAAKLRAFASREDRLFCALPHDLKNRGGFISTIKADRKPASATSTVLWQEKEGAYTTAAVALMCLTRYENTGKTVYHDFVTAAAELYLKSPPPKEADLWPRTFGHAISLQVAAWRHTARMEHLEAARRLADEAVAKFWGDSPLPRASLKSEHYESITGSDTLALALVELHLNILHITAVRCPSNTVDR
jgi:hypothetical protein